jgi:hypothetical protein
MGKLPGNLAKPAFDNPLRPTSTPSTPPASAVVIPMNPESIAAAPATEDNSSSETVTADAPIHRQSVSFTDAQWKALQAECHRRRMAGDKGVNVARVVRDLVEEWRARST